MRAARKAATLSKGAIRVIAVFLSPPRGACRGYRPAVTSWYAVRVTAEGTSRRLLRGQSCQIAGGVFPPMLE